MRAVPFNRPTLVTDGGPRYLESFDPRAFADDTAGPFPLYENHAHIAGELPVGITTKVRSTPDALIVEATYQNSPEGDRALQRVRDALATGKRVGVSVGFRALQSVKRGDVTIRTKARLREVSVLVGRLAGKQQHDGAVLALRASDAPTTPRITKGPEVSPSITTSVRMPDSLRDAFHRAVEGDGTNANAKFNELAATYVRSRHEKPKPTTAEAVGNILRNYFLDANGNLSMANRSEQGLAALMRAADLSADASGLLPTAVAGDAYVPLVDASRPAVNGSSGGRGPLAMPDKGSSFIVPTPTQLTTDGTQSTQDTALSTQKMTIGATTVSKVSKGGYVTISEQLVDWSDPSFVDLLLADLAQQYAAQGEAALCSAISSAATTTVSAPASWNSAANVIAALRAAKASVRSTCKLNADTLYLGGTHYDDVLTLQDTAGGLLVDADDGGTLCGMNVVYSPGFGATFAAVANSSFVQFFENVKGQAQIANPSTMSIDVAWRGYIATNVFSAGAAGFA
jgi:hypothetical protein